MTASVIVEAYPEVDASGKLGRVDEPTPRRGRPLDPEVGRAALEATVELLEERGYAGLRVGDVAQRAGIGLGALYRRWPTKRELVVSALGSMASDLHLPVTDDPAGDVLAVLEVMADAITGPEARILAGLLSGSDEPELATAIREAKIEPLRATLRERLRRILGDVDDLEIRTDLGPALILFRALVLDRAMRADELRRAVLPLLLAKPR